MRGCAPSTSRRPRAPRPRAASSARSATYWVTAMDAARAERLGRHPLDAELARIDAVHDARSALDEAFALRAIEVEAFFKVRRQPG